MECLTAQERELLQSDELGQPHLTPAGASEVDLRRLSEQLSRLDKVCPGGLKDYVRRSRKLLADSKDNVNPFDGCKVSVPIGESLDVGSCRFNEMEKVGVEEMGRTAFVLVAGGLGERLGYPGIKISLPSESTTGMPYIGLYCQHILEFQRRANLHRPSDIPPILLPLALMTSDDTHERTLQLLQDHQFFGMRSDQVLLLKQDKVPALIDDAGRFAVSQSDKFVIETKPHGHGDVHTLLYNTGTATKWLEQGLKWVIFFQDTNGLALRGLISVIGVSKSQGLSMNHLAIERRPGEAVGAICRITDERTNVSRTTNVEYNQLEGLLKSHGRGDEPDENGLSCFPGNTNALVFDLQRYSSALSRSRGVTPEFVNPKYQDVRRTKFKTPARLECMMQDFARVFEEPDDIVGYTTCNRWHCFSTLKNNNDDAAVRGAAGIAPESALSSESDQYYQSCHLLRLAAGSKKCVVSIPESVPLEILGVKYRMGPRVVLHPSFGLTLADIAEKIEDQSKIELGKDSTLILSGNVRLNGISVSGSLVAAAGNDSTLHLNNLKVSNAGHEMRRLSGDELENAPCFAKIRGFVIEKRDLTEIRVG